MSTNSAGALLVTFALSACGSSEWSASSFDDDKRFDATAPRGSIESSLNSSQKRQRSDEIKAASASKGLTNALLVAGIANHESGLAQCWAEATWTCQGPWSSDCGGPSLAGAADGPCSWQQGGIGMFQLDSGNYAQTLAQYGADVVSVSGNTRAGVDVIVYKVRHCPNTPVFAGDGEVIDWLNRARPGTAEYESFITAMAWCYNGCAPSYTSCSHAGIRNAYKSGVNELLAAFGEAYWYAPPPPPPPELSPARATGKRVATNAHGRLQVFARASDGSLAHAWQLEPNGGWSGWGNLGGVLASDPVVGANEDGRLEVFHVGTDGALHHRWQLWPDLSWHGAWASLGGANIVGEPAVASNADGRLEVFVRTSSGGLFHKWQNAPNGGWSEWRELGGLTRSDPVAAVNPDGRIELFVRGGDDALWHIWQLAPSGDWGGWSSLGGVLTSEPAVGRNADGRLEAFHVGTDGALYSRWREGAGWSGGWYPHGGADLVGEPAIGSNADGRLEAFVRTAGGGVVHQWQLEPNGGWSGFADTGAYALSDPAVGVNADGRLELFVRGGDAALWHRWQQADGWGAWARLGAEALSF